MNARNKSREIPTQMIQIPIEEAFLREQLMLDSVKTGNDIFLCMFWEASHRCLVAPKSMQRILGEASAQGERERWPIFYRSTGGDVTPQGPGIVNFSVAYTRPAGERSSISQSYEDLCSPILSALKRVGLLGWTGSIKDSFCDGSYNVVVGNKKFAGTAQRITKTSSAPRRTAILAHALMMVDGTAHDGVNAINQLYKSANLDRRANPKANTSLSSQGLDKWTFINALTEEANSYFYQLY